MFFTVIVHVAFLLLEVDAVIVAVPLATGVTLPLELTLATLVLLDDHVTDLSVALVG